MLELGKTNHLSCHVSGHIMARWFSRSGAALGFLVLRESDEVAIQVWSFPLGMVYKSTSQQPQELRLNDAQGI